MGLSSFLIPGKQGAMSQREHSRTKLNYSLRTESLQRQNPSCMMLVAILVFLLYEARLTEIHSGHKFRVCPGFLACT